MMDRLMPEEPNFGITEVSVFEAQNTMVRKIKLTEDETGELFRYLHLRLVTPIIGLEEPDLAQSVLEVNTNNPLFCLIIALGDVDDALLVGEVEESEFSFLEGDMKFLLNDFEEQVDLGDSEAVEEFIPMMDSVRAKWEGVAL